MVKSLLFLIQKDFINLAKKNQNLSIAQFLFLIY